MGDHYLFLKKLQFSSAGKPIGCPTSWSRLTYGESREAHRLQHIVFREPQLDGSGRK